MYKINPDSTPQHNREKITRGRSEELKRKSIATGAVHKVRICCIHMYTAVCIYIDAVLLLYAYNEDHMEREYIVENI